MGGLFFKPFGRFLLTLFGVLVQICLLAKPALATQSHGAPEGLYAHQIAHLFFLAAMGILVYWLRVRGLVRNRGWRRIQYAAFFFILWNLDTFFVHMLDEAQQWVAVQDFDFRNIHLKIHVGGLAVGWLYYFAKLDHLLCVPALGFLYAGLKHLIGDEEASEPGEEASS